MRSTNQILPLLYKNRLNALSILSFPKSFVVVVVFGDAHLSCAAALLSSRVALRVVRMARKRGRRDDDGRQPNATLTTLWGARG